MSQSLQNQFAQHVANFEKVYPNSVFFDQVQQKLKLMIQLNPKKEDYVDQCYRQMIEELDSMFQHYIKAPKKTVGQKLEDLIQDERKQYTISLEQFAYELTSYFVQLQQKPNKQLLEQTPSLFHLNLVSHVSSADWIISSTRPEYDMFCCICQQKMNVFKAVDNHNLKTICRVYPNSTKTLHIALKFIFNRYLAPLLKEQNHDIKKADAEAALDLIASTHPNKFIHNLCLYNSLLKK